MAELDVGIFLRHRQHVRIEIAERGREQQRGAVEVDHRLHRLLDVDRLRHVLLFDDGDAFHLLQRRGALGMGLVVAVVVLRPDIDEADGEIGGERRRKWQPARGQAQRRATGGLQQVPAGQRDPSRDFRVIEFSSLAGPAFAAGYFLEVYAIEKVYATCMPRANVLKINKLAFDKRP